MEKEGVSAHFCLGFVVMGEGNEMNFGSPVDLAGHCIVIIQIYASVDAMRVLISPVSYLVDQSKRSPAGQAGYSPGFTNISSTKIIEKNTKGKDQRLSAKALAAKFHPCHKLMNHGGVTFLF